MKKLLVVLMLSLSIVANAFWTHQEVYSYVFERDIDVVSSTCINNPQLSVGVRTVGEDRDILITGNFSTGTLYNAKIFFGKKVIYNSRFRAMSSEMSSAAIDGEVLGKMMSYRSMSILLETSNGNKLYEVDLTGFARTYNGVYH